MMPQPCDVTATANTAPSHGRILRVAIPKTRHSGFDYLPNDGSTLLPGQRVRVSLGRRTTIGIITELREHSAIAADKLKPISAVLDPKPIFTADLLQLAHWASDYYHHPLGEVLHCMLPTRIRRGLPVTTTTLYWRATAAGSALELAALKRAPQQQAVLQLLRQYPQGVSATHLREQINNSSNPLKALQHKGLVEVHERPNQIMDTAAADHRVIQPDAAIPTLNPDQQQAYAAVAQQLNGFQPWVLQGVTGSGKTEVYLQLITEVLQQKRQVLVLVPEIGLTPQLLQRFTARFALPILVMHSGLSDGERQQVWLKSATAQPQIVIGTRSAVFLPLQKLGLIVIDEEHDGSFKQQDSFRYHARDIAVIRAQRLNIPIVLGSATPSLESLHNVSQDRYRLLELPERAGNAVMPRITVLAAKHIIAEQLITEPLRLAMQQHLQHGHQVLLFLNRRGYAPILLCQACGWRSRCQRCDAYMTLHQYDQRLRCHHCGSDQPAPKQCPECTQPNPLPVGYGTERIELYLQQTFPEYSIIRIDRDATRRKGALEQQLAKIQSGAAQILIGTQMLAKGHHFPDVTLVGVLGIDQGLFSADFRGPEYMAQLITQVGGRAGRGQHRGEVFIETQQPEHPLLQRLIQYGYSAFAKDALQERDIAALPPIYKYALIRAEAKQASKALEFLQQLRDQIAVFKLAPAELLGPVPAPMERRAGYFRAQLLIQAPARPALHRCLQQLHTALEQAPQRRSVRWSIDVDPMDML